MHRGHSVGIVIPSSHTAHLPQTVARPRSSTRKPIVPIVFFALLLLGASLHYVNKYQHTRPQEQPQLREVKKRVPTPPTAPDELEEPGWGGERRVKPVLSGVKRPSRSTTGKAAKPPRAEDTPRRKPGTGLNQRRMGLDGKPFKPFGGRPSFCVAPKNWEEPQNVDHPLIRQDDGVWRVKDDRVDEYDQECGDTDMEKATAVVDATLHAWKGYTEYAWGHDEAHPGSGYRDWSLDQPYAVTMIDSLDTLWIMGLRQEFDESVAYLDQNLNPIHNGNISVFEVTIRVIGGLLGAYTLSVDDVLLEKAKDIADTLLPAFDIYPTGVPPTLFNPTTHHHGTYSWTRDNVILSEVGSIQLEWRYLSWLLGEGKYDQVVTKAFEVFFPSVVVKDIVEKRITSDGSEDVVEQVEETTQRKGYLDGLYPLFINPLKGRFASNTYSVGSLGDSFYECLLKQYILSNPDAMLNLEKRGVNKQDDDAGDISGPYATYNIYNDMFKQSTKGMRRHLSDKEGKYTLLGFLRSGSLHKRMDHLSCFLPGTILLHIVSLTGWSMDAMGEEEKELFKWAEDMMTTCVLMYDETELQLGAEAYSFKDGKMTVEKPFNILRPEAVESLFYFYRFTKKPWYRKVGWRIFTAIETHCKVAEGGYVGVDAVTDVDAKQKKSMESFFIAETLKYLFLLFTDPSFLPLTKYVLTTEGHPFPLGKPRPSYASLHDLPKPKSH